MKLNDAANESTLAATYNMNGASRHARPSHVGRYKLGETLGAGAMGTVYRAHDPDLDRTVAIKVVRTSDSSSEARVLREAQAMARLRHPNVVPIFDVGLAEGAVFVVMQLMEGSTLRRWLKTDSPAFGQILERFCAAGRGLAAAHAAGLVHRDFKPENVLLGAGGETQVSDFGLACLVQGETTPSTSASMLRWSEITQTGDILGTPAYMAPEQLRGRPSDARADQFSFCIALWEAIFGERPFAEDPSDTGDSIRARLDAIAAGPVAAAQRRARPAWILPVLARGLEAEPARRWPTMDALLDAIAAGCAPRRWPRRLAIGIGSAALALAIALWSRLSPPAPSSLRPVQLTHHENLASAAISLDGTKLAMVVGDSLVLREINGDAQDRVLVEHGIADNSISWSPDGKRLLVATIPEVVDVVQTALVDVHDGLQYKLPATGFSAFLSNDEIAVTSYRQHSVRIFPLGQHAAPIAACQVSGDYTIIESLAGMPDGTMILETSTGGTRNLVILDHDCRVRARYPKAREEQAIYGIALSDEGTVVTLVPKAGAGEILELSLDGAEVSRHPVSGELERVIGRRRGADYVLTLALKTLLHRAYPTDPPTGSPTDQFSVNGPASFSIAPNDGMLAWIERGSRLRPRGPLRVSTLQDLKRSGPALLDNAVSVGWSPDGQWLAALVDEDAGTGIAILDRVGRIKRRWALPHVDPTGQPVWLDGHRVAYQTDDRTTYRSLDRETGAEGDITDRAHGPAYWLTRSPRDGTLAMWHIGKPGAIDAHTEHLWLQSPGHEAAPLHVDEATRYYLLPSWSPDGDLLVRALETGVVSRVDLTTGKLTQLAQLPRMLLWIGANEEHLLTLPGGDLLAVETESGMNVSIVRPDDRSPQRSSGARPRGAL